jgi:hypothetical protein
MALSMLAVPSAARAPAVHIKQLSVNKDVPLDVDTVRTTLANELRKVDSDQVAESKRRAYLTVNVTRNARTPFELEYMVSAVVVDARKGNVLGTVEGHARGALSSGLEQATLEGAAHGALQNVSSFLR